MGKYSTAKTLVNVAFAAVYIVCVVAAMTVKGTPMMALPVIIGALSFVGHMTIHAAFDIAINSAKQVEQNELIMSLLAARAEEK
ncbi:hypothetical protein C7R88_05735 [Plesiomonas shigelloides]|uniref:hypothetical protein n=1 Tax=Plesiomonas shigelloides TaxID=703 RepID=UPI000D1298B7|nr:hypothetical protein [Plesiomonas shigelloides]AVQ86859.1 hypothetical protein C7R88_05735 [Plesiomonas shigelloides]